MGMRGAPGVAALMIASVVGGCMSSPSSDSAPAWLAETTAEARKADYPALETLPDKSGMLRPRAGWARLDQEMQAEAARVRASPRSAPPALDAQAQAELEAEAEKTLEARPPSAKPPAGER